MYMGRVVEAASWDPASERPEDYLPHYTGPGGTPALPHLDRLRRRRLLQLLPRLPQRVRLLGHLRRRQRRVRRGRQSRTAITFRVSYQVIGWLPDAADGPARELAATVTSQYDQYVAQCAEQRVQPVSKPTDVFARVTADQFGWQFSDNAISYTLGPATSSPALRCRTRRCAPASSRRWCGTSSTRRATRRSSLRRAERDRGPTRWRSPSGTPPWRPSPRWSRAT